MRSFKDALFSPAHAILLLPVVYFGMAAQVADLFNWIEPNYAYLSGMLSVVYTVSVFIEWRRDGSGPQNDG